MLLPHILIYLGNWEVKGDLWGFTFDWPV